MAPPLHPRLKQNNFDFLRLFFAWLVCFLHAYELSGYEDIGVLASGFFSGMALKSFFVISGFLIFLSCERSSSWSSYASKRVRRIYPAYFTVVMLAGIALVGVSSKSASDYFFSAAWLKYLAANLTFMNFLHPTLPGVFETNKLPAVNGALWTLKVEASFYMLVPMFVFLFRKYSRPVIMFGVYAASVAYGSYMNWKAVHTGSSAYLELGKQLPGQLAYFMSGAFFYYHLEWFERNVMFIVPTAMAIILLDQVFPLPLFEPLALAAIVAFMGMYFYLGNFGKYGDFSYGFYILHFPVIQLYVYSGWFKGHDWYFLAAVLATTGLGAIAMWHLVEKRFLLRNSHYVAATVEARSAS